MRQMKIKPESASSINCAKNVVSFQIELSTSFGTGIVAPQLVVEWLAAQTELQDILNVRSQCLIT